MGIKIALMILVICIVVMISKMTRSIPNDK